MTLFVYFSMPLFVLYLALFKSTVKLSGNRNLFLLFVVSGLCGLPISSLTGIVENAFFPLYDASSVYLRVLILDHGFPLVSALGVFLSVRWVAVVRRHWQWDMTFRLVIFGGFYSVFEALNQFAHYSDPSWYQLIILPLLRLSTVGTVVSLLTIADGQHFWRGIGLVLTMSVLLILTAVISSAAILQWVVPAVTGGLAIVLTAIPTIYLMVKMTAKATHNGK